MEEPIRNAIESQILAKQQNVELSTANALLRKEIIERKQADPLLQEARDASSVAFGP